MRVLERITEVSALEWNALAGDYPFLRHEFLAALEDSGCASARTGWTPQHLALFDGQGLAAAAPLYRKEHSWGEFVFDFAWARAAEQRGLTYYPKLVCAVPFTPATGARLLCRPGAAATGLCATPCSSGMRTHRRRAHAVPRCTGYFWTSPPAWPASRMVGCCDATAISSGTITAITTSTMTSGAFLGG